MTAPVRRIVVIGASGNVGTGVLRALARSFPDAEVVGVCRRPPTRGHAYQHVMWHAVDLSSPNAAADLAPAVRGADVVAHLALAVQPVRDEDYLYRANVLGSRAVLDAVAAASVRYVIYASSLSVYAPGATAPVTESWPDTGQATSTYSRHKALVERMLDQFVEEHPEVRVGRFRPTVVVQREAAWLIKSLYLGPLVPRAALELLRRRRLPALPLPTGIALQFVHADDVGDAVIRMIRHRVAGSFNVAADVLDTDALARLVGGKAIRVKPGAMRAVISALSAMRVVAVTPGWYDVATDAPLMDITKARNELDWTPTRSSTSSARELIEGLADGAVGTSAAMGSDTLSPSMFRITVNRVHDASLALWTGLALTRALQGRRAGVSEAAVVAINLVSGTPTALDRIADRRRDTVALLAPVAVVAALAATARGGWAPVAATGVLHVLNALDRTRRTPKTVT